MDLLAFGEYLNSLGEEAIEALAVRATPAELEVMVKALAAVEARSTALGWLYDPVGWVNAHVDFSSVTGANKGLTAYQTDILAELVHSGRLAVRSPNGTGKSTTAALAILWFAITRELAGIDWKIPTTATVGRQLVEYLWPEVHLWAARLRWDAIGRQAFTRDELQVTRIKLARGSAWAMASTNPAAIEGAHASHLLYIFDEAKMIPAPIWDAAEGAFAGAGTDTEAEAWALAVSTPGEPAGRFYDIHRRARGYLDWAVRHVTLADAVAAGRVSAEWADNRAGGWGVTTAIYRNRVLGEFASSEADAIIPLPWVEAAVERWHDSAAPAYVTGEADITSIGVDVAGSGEDETVIVCVGHDYVYEPVRPGQGDSIFTATAVAPHAIAHLSQPMVVVDADGIGLGTYDQLARMAQLAERVFAFHGSAKPEVAGRVWEDHSGVATFGNLRCAAYWHLRDLLNPANSPTLCIPPDDLLIGDITAGHWRVGQNGRYYVEDKSEIKKRLGHSPDSADALVYALWGALVQAAGAAMAVGVPTGAGSTIMGDLLSNQSW